MATDFSGDLIGPHLDLASALSKIGEESAVRDMLVMLADLLAQDAPKIQQALLNQDTALAARLLHSLKGCMPIFCHPPICELVAVAEQHAKRGDSALASEVYASLGPALVVLTLEIQSHLAAPAATLK